jgi:hypothetical protein
MKVAILDDYQNVKLADWSAVRRRAKTLAKQRREPPARPFPAEPAVRSWPWR